MRLSELPGHGAVCGVPDADVAPRGWGRGARGGGGGGGGGDDWGGGVGGAMQQQQEQQQAQQHQYAPARRARNDDYLLCPHCNEPCEQLDDLQVHMLVTHPEAPPVDFGAPADTTVPTPAVAPQAPIGLPDFSGFVFSPPPTTPARSNGGGFSFGLPPSGGTMETNGAGGFTFDSSNATPGTAPTANNNSNDNNNTGGGAGASASGGVASSSSQGFPFQPPPPDDEPRK